MSEPPKVSVEMRELIDEPAIFADRNATTEQEAAAMAWDLYFYAVELRAALRACKEMR